ncbi:MAG: thiamine-phosphate kinase [Candidatus Methanospirare jalkutatii]|nr:MAG: thiamine-phosphate kinase [Candidatus Methanospirare jalkutatii]UYZ40260.1 MAG: thiamine-phosphate kinase [Candidatus Methanospirare jalkutatii]
MSEKLEEVGERRLIERIRERFKEKVPFLEAGAGADDCAVVDFDALRGACLTEVKGKKAGKGKAREACKMLVTTDMLLKSSHFPEGITPFQMGWSVVAVNLSDIAAMGACPLLLTVAIGLPEGTEISFFDEILRGISACCEKYQTVVVGGDIVKSAEMTFSGTCIGFATHPLRRKGAKVGDFVCVTGTLGDAALGMKVVRGKIKLRDALASYAKRALFQPEPRVREGLLIASSGYATAMIDISDGLAISLAELASQNGVGFEIWEESVPVSEALKACEISKSERRELVFHFGGDYELLFTADASILEDNKTLEMLKSEAKVSIIGRVVPKERGIYVKSERGEKEQIALKGYQHF